MPKISAETAVQEGNADVLASLLRKKKFPQEWKDEQLGYAVENWNIDTTFVLLQAGTTLEGRNKAADRLVYRRGVTYEPLLPALLIDAGLSPDAKQAMKAKYNPILIKDYFIRKFLLLREKREEMQSRLPRMQNLTLMLLWPIGSPLTAYSCRYSALWQRLA